MRCNMYITTNKVNHIEKNKKFKKNVKFVSWEEGRVGHSVNLNLEKKERKSDKIIWRLGELVMFWYVGSKEYEGRKENKINKLAVMYCNVVGVVFNVHTSMYSDVNKQEILERVCKKS